MKQATAPSICRKNPLLHFLLHEIQTRAGLDAFGCGLFVDDSIEIRRHFLLYDLGLGEKRLQGQRKKILHFELKGEELWTKSQEFLESPVIQRIYCDDIRSNVEYPVCGINALAHYSWLNPDKEKMFMLTDKEYRSLRESEVFDNPNVYDGRVIIEVWKYPAVGHINENKTRVDRLSLALSLKTDEDPRVEKEVERMIKGIQWKD